MAKMLVKLQGFTLVELVIVIVLLGILAASALPRFINISEDAHLANLKAMTGALRSAHKLVQHKWYLSGKPETLDILGDSNADLIFNQTTEALVGSGDGTQAATLIGAVPTTDDNKRCKDLFQALITDMDIDVPPTNCQAAYGTSYSNQYCAVKWQTNANFCEAYYMDMGDSSNYYSIIYCLADCNIGAASAKGGEFFLHRNNGGTSSRLF